MNRREFISLLASAGLPAPAYSQSQRARSSSLYPDGAVFTVDRLKGVRLGREDTPPYDQSFDVAVVEFDDDGTFVDPGQLKAAAECITAARDANRNGALVVLFIHGWHHSARWDIGKYASQWDAEAADDQHFRNFRRVLMGLATREAERYLPTGEGGRRVVGIYLGWNGDPTTSWFGQWLSRTEHATHLSFYDRYRAAERLGGGSAIRQAIRTIVEFTKSPVQDRPESPLVLAGHSMGALVLEATFLALLREAGDPLFKVLDPQSPSASRSGVEVKLDGRRVAFPDLLLALNSAADSGLVREILGEVESRKLTKRITAANIDVDYAPPLLVSVTSSADDYTGVTWRRAQTLQQVITREGFARMLFGGYEGLHTDGHDPALRTHDFTALGGRQCDPKPGRDYGQDWHCLRFPVPRSQPTPSFAIDLPEISRHAPGGPTHRRFQLEPRFPSERRLAWLFQVPPELVKEHSDIFNPRSSLLFMALMQISGAVMSLAQDVDRNFEPE